MGNICAGGRQGSPEEKKTSAQIDQDLRSFRKEFEHGPLHFQYIVDAYLYC
jgi:hypothetical protein